MNLLSPNGAVRSAASLFVAASFPNVIVTHETSHDVAARERLLDRAFGPGRHLKTSARLRAGREPASGLSLVARDCETDQLLGTVRLWNVAFGNDADAQAALLLGPLAVDPEVQGAGVGCKLMRHAIAEATFRGHAAVILVGDPEYYARFGFSSDKTGDLRLPGPVEQHRFLGLDLCPGALAGARGLVRATGKLATAANDHLISALAV